MSGSLASVLTNALCTRLTTADGVMATLQSTMRPLIDGVDDAGPRQQQGAKCIGRHLVLCGARAGTGRRLDAPQIDAVR